MNSLMLNASACELFEIPFYQFAQFKKYCPADIPRIKADYKSQWERWKAINLAVSQLLGVPFAKPHIESWTNGWQVRAHFFAYFKYEYNQHSAAIFSVLLNCRRLRVCLDWHCYRAARSQINLNQYNQWWDELDFKRFGDFAVWRGDTDEYGDFPSLSNFSPALPELRDAQDYWCIGRTLEKPALADADPVAFIVDTIRALEPLYQRAHQI